MFILTLLHVFNFIAQYLFYIFSLNVYIWKSTEGCNDQPEFLLLVIQVFQFVIKVSKLNLLC